MKLALLLLAACTTLIAPFADARDITANINEPQAELRVTNLLKEHGAVPVLESYSNPSNLGFYYFEQINPNSDTSVHVRTVAVDKRFGDIWEVDGSVCHRLDKVTRPRRGRAPAECEEVSN